MFIPNYEQTTLIDSVLAAWLEQGDSGTVDITDEQAELARTILTGLQPAPEVTVSDGTFVCPHCGTAGEIGAYDYECILWRGDPNFAEQVLQLDAGSQGSAMDWLGIDQPYCVHCGKDVSLPEDWTVIL